MLLFNIKLSIVNVLCIFSVSNNIIKCITLLRKYSFVNLPDVQNVTGKALV